MANEEVARKLQELQEENDEILEQMRILREERSNLNQLRVKKGGLPRTEMGRLMQIKQELSDLGADHQDLIRERADLRKTIVSDSEIFQEAARLVLTGEQFDAFMDNVKELRDSPR